ncbi:hypothetical protein BU17DRAFT_87191 [Hysterangium stoloniferum]|nr:hypothetical protein BU17DRAFT_87191 [Hysterangium stoloniferum]
MHTNEVEASGGNTTLIVFLALQIIGGQVGVPFILFTIFLSPETVRRHVCFVNFCISWLIYSVSYVLLLYGGQIETPVPSHSLCLAQTALTYGAGPMASIASFIFVLQIYVALNAALSEQSVPKPPRHPKFTIAAATPYIVFFVIIIAVLVYGHTHPTEIVRVHFYCHISTRAFAAVPPAVSAIFAVLAVIVEIVIARRVYLTWHAFRQLDASNSGINLSLLIRAALFSVCCILGIMLCGALLANTSNPAPGIVIAFLPMAVFLMFGTQPDMLRAWGLWRDEDQTRTQLSSQQLSEPSRHHQSIPLHVKAAAAS